MKKRIIALLLSVTLAMGSVGTVSASAAEAGAGQTDETATQEEASAGLTDETAPEEEEEADAGLTDETASEETEEADAGQTDETAPEETRQRRQPPALLIVPRLQRKLQLRVQQRSRLYRSRHMRHP